jgi:DNA-binding MarR family transcriptional regulator
MTQSSRVPPPQSADVDGITDKTLRGFVGYNVKRAFNVIQAELVKTLEPFGLRMVTYSALAIIVDNPGLRPSQLAHALSIERTNMVVIVDELEEKGLIVREQSPTDRRAYALNATLAGRRLHDRATKANRRHEDALLGALRPDEVDHLLRALHKIETAAEDRSL